MNKRFCDCCGIEVFTSEPKYIFEEGKNTPKTKTIKRFNPIKNKIEEQNVYETEEVATDPVTIQLNLNNYDMMMREFCTPCYKKIHSQVEAFWNTLYAAGNI